MHRNLSMDTNIRLSVINRFPSINLSIILHRLAFGSPPPHCSQLFPRLISSSHPLLPTTASSGITTRRFTHALLCLLFTRKKYFRSYILGFEVELY